MMVQIKMMMSVLLTLLLWSLVKVHSQTVPYVSFMPMSQTPLANHAYVNISLVGSDGSGSNSVQCHTDLELCCSGTQGPIHRGDWYFPNGTRLPFSGDGDIYEFRAAERVDLRRSNNPTSPTGIYRCDIPTNAVHNDDDISVRDTVYVGLYTATGGDISISGGVTFDPDQLTLTCISTGGPATTVTWTRDSTTVTQGTVTVLNDPVTAHYTHTLTVTTAGEYTCTVANNKPSSASSASTTVAGAPPPTGVTAVQTGPTSITVTWTPPSPLGDITGYTISYTGGGSSGSVDVSGGNTMTHTRTGLTNGQTYTISIVASTNGLSSAPEQATVGLVPSAPVLDSTPTVATTTITISGSVPSGSVVTGYVVQWQRDTSLVCPDLSDDGSIPVTSSSFTGRTITGLEPGNRYTITVTFSNGAGSSPVSTAVTAMTTATAPTGPPGPITLVTVTPNSATVQWGEVTCPQRNGEITGYTVTATKAGGMEEGTASVGGDARQATISGLIPSTEYSVQVAAVNMAGTGPYSSPITIMTRDGLTVSATPSSSTSLTISWTLEDSLTATSYTISFSNTNTNCFTNSSSGIPASGTSHTLTGLEEGTEYSITVTATLTGNGGTPQGKTTATTLTAAPSAPPTEVRVSVNSSTSITVQWGPVECRRQNGEITGYWLRYGEEGSIEEEPKMVSGDSSGGVATVSGLTRETVYTVQVAAVTSGGTGVYSDPLMIQTPDDVFLSLNGAVIPDHGLLNISDIGSTDETALLCITNRPGSPNSGNWFAPDGTRVDTTDVPGFERNRGPMVVRLKRNTATDPAAEGIYQCSVNDTDSRPHSLYVGLYTSGRGRIMLSTLPPYSITNGASPQFTLTCISTGGPATTVTWTRDNVNITGEQKTVLNDPETAEYTHTLNVTTAGDYICTVSNIASSASATIPLEGTSPPTAVTAVQDGPTSITVTWTPSSDATGYRIDYDGGGVGGSEELGADSTRLKLTNLTIGETYTISIVATSPSQLASSPIMKQVRLVPTPAQPVVDTDALVATADTITLSWAVPPDVTGSEVSWELSGETSRRRRVRNAEGGTSGRLPADQNSYTIDKLSSGTSYDITVTVFNPAGGSSTTFTRSTEEGSSTSSPGGGSGVGGIVAGVIVAIVLVVAVVAIVIVVVWLVKRRRSTVSKYVPAERDSVRYSAKDGKVSSAEAPVIVEFPVDTRVQEGEGVVFRVEVTGVPHPKLTWYHDGVEVVPDYSRELGEDGTLTLLSAETKHSGVYQLVAKNRGGSVEREVKLQVDQEGVEQGIAAEEPSYETVALSGPVPVAAFGSHVEQRHSKNNKPFKVEYEGLPTYADKSVAVATSPNNKLKNRFANICVYDDDRVVLKPLAQYDSDYVNASYVDGYSTKGKFIATQGPLPKTVVDFWRLVWQERSPTIVMITNLVEGSKIKCQQYWPEGGAQAFGPFQITITDQQTLADYTLRHLLVQLKGGSGRPLKVTQFHFTAWPDHGVPDYATPILTFHRRVMKEHKSGPIVAHCSAGVGRTGTFITIDQALEAVEKEGKVDIPGIIANLRQQRTKMVQTLDQYIFIHDAILEAVTCGDTQVESGDLRKTLGQLQRRDQSGRTDMEIQFSVLEQVSPNPKDAKVSVALKHPKKNRSKDFLPLDKWRVLIKGESPDYINASVAHGYKQHRAFIIAQNPMQSTARDFWKIACDRKCGVLVMLCDLVETGKETCYQYWPSSGTLTVGEFTVELIQEEKLSGFSIRNFGVYNEKSNKSHQLTQFHITNWEPDGNCSNIKTVTDVIEEVGKVQRRTGNHPIMVHCSDTVSRSGMFCAIATTIERCKTEGVVDVFQVVKALRVQKPGAVRTVLQYRIIFEAVLEYLDSFSLYSNF